MWISVNSVNKRLVLAKKQLYEHKKYVYNSLHKEKNVEKHGKKLKLSTIQVQKAQSYPQLYRII